MTLNYEGAAMTEQTTSSASEVFQQALAGIQAGDLSDLLERCTDDVVFEFPFAPADRPGRVEGRDAVREYLGPIFARTQTQGLSSLVMHQTVDLAVAVIEFTATAQISGGPAREVSYVVVLTVRDGQIARYRDYWNPLALAGQASRS
jgi:ketosteroid isomerase-like protein